MNYTTLVIHGCKVKFSYEIIEGGNVQWALSHVVKSTDPNAELFETLLRIHYNEFISAQIREVWYREEYERHMREIHKYEDIPF